MLRQFASVALKHGGFTMTWFPKYMFEMGAAFLRKSSYSEGCVHFAWDFSRVAASERSATFSSTIFLDFYSEKRLAFTI